MAKSKYPERKLLVEGTTDLFFIAELWKKQRNSDALDHFQIISMDGKEKLIQSLSDSNNVIWKSKTTHLGIVVDADTSAENTLQSVCNALERGGYTGLSQRLEVSGQIQNINGVNFGVWVMPDNKQPGMTEDLFLSLFSDDQNKAQHLFAVKTLEDLEKQNLNRYDKNLHRSKAAAHTLLAWQTEPGYAMGNAVQANLVCLPENLPFVDWLGRLFEIDK